MLSSAIYASPFAIADKSLFISAPRTSPKFRVCFSVSASNQNPIDEEARWLREEQRWLREEQRWLREEQRWNADRHSLLHEITCLKLRIEELERLNSLKRISVPEAISDVAKLPQVGSADTGSSAVPLTIKAPADSQEVFIAISNDEETTKRRETLRKGSEGDDVLAMQEALQRLGFYSGEEDMEFSSFSSGTERAVKTWQATLGEPEDGVMTADLLDGLFASVAAKHIPQASEASTIKTTNGAAAGATTEISKLHHRIATTEESAVEEEEEEEASQHHRVFLLGENRWEEPSRLRKATPAKTVVTGRVVTKCPSCRGEGRLLCMECDGTGEPNVEPQFLEWVDEGGKCPYCDGLGYTTCDACSSSSSS
ncbi:hypothetical protein M569_16164 [Genlisea aurea]|uniref:Peptidoglycan binding-like domain-containing protein n=1 Tax=Genlisea aurea TaxID=192259 RepID=S8D7H4_9LAMI|nr:hypothetical protein M569_16164 [Genlisea aurea]